MGLKIVITIAVSWLIVAAYIMTSSGAEPQIQMVNDGEAMKPMLTINRTGMNLMNIVIHGNGEDAEARHGCQDKTWQRGETSGCDGYEAL